MKKFFFLGVCLCVLLCTLALAKSNCVMKVHSKLTQGSVLLCGRKNGGFPGARFNYSLAPGDTYTYNCPETTATNSYEVYFSYRNDTECTWDTCRVNTGTCKSYPWTLGEGVSWANGYWYGFVAANFDGAGLGYQGSYNSSKVRYGVQLLCSSYGTKPWNGTCYVDGKTGKPGCNPDVPNFKHPATGVVACGPAHNEGTLELNLFES